VTSQQTPGGIFPTFRSAPRRLWRAVRWLWRKLWRPAAILLAALIIAHLVLNVIAGRRLERELNRLRAEGAPLTLAEAAPPAVPDSENAALLYTRAFRGFGWPRASEDEDHELVARFLSTVNGIEDYPPGIAPTMAEVEAVLARHKADFSLLDQASRRPACRFPVDWNAGFGALLPHLSGVRMATRFLAAKGVVDARHGRAVDALNDLAIAIRMSNHISPEPALISQLVRIACIHIVRGVLPEVLAAAPPTEAQSRAFYDLLGNVDINGPWLHAMQGERAAGILAFRDLQTARSGYPAVAVLNEIGEGESLGWVRTRAGKFALTGLWWLTRVAWAPALKLDEARYLELLRKQMLLLRKPFAESQRDYSRLENEASERAPWYALVSRSLFPQFGPATATRDQGVAGIGLMTVALALRDHKIKHGSYPASLADLRAAGGWAIPDDPFSGKPFIYRRQGAGYLIYGLGPDLKDNGGVDSVTARGRQRPGTAASQIAYDIPLRMPR